MAYLDDILIYLETLKEYTKYIYKVLKALKEKDL